MRQLVIALVAAGLIAGSTYAAATSLGGLQATDVAADVDTITACDTDGVTAEFVVANTGVGQFEPSMPPTPGSEVDGVRVHGIAETCAGKNIYIKLYDQDRILIAVNAGNLPNPLVDGFNCVAGARCMYLNMDNVKVKYVAAIEVRID